MYVLVQDAQSLTIVQKAISKNQTHVLVAAVSAEKDVLYKKEIHHPAFVWTKLLYFNLGI